MDEERNGTGEWTLERARQIWQLMTAAVQHVGVPGFEFQTGVLWNGSLLIGPTSFLDLEGMKEEFALLGLGDHFLHLTIGQGEETVISSGTRLSSHTCSAAISKKACRRKPMIPSSPTCCSPSGTLVTGRRAVISGSISARRSPYVWDIRCRWRRPCPRRSPIGTRPHSDWLTGRYAIASRHRSRAS